MLALQLALHRRLLRHWVVHLVMMVYLGSRLGFITLTLPGIELGRTGYGLKKMVVRVYWRLVGSVKSARKRIIFWLLLNYEATL